MKHNVKRMLKRWLRGKAAAPGTLATGKAPAPEPVCAKPPEESSRSWSTSSLELKHGADIVEFSQDTMPSAFFDEDFKPHAPKPPRKK